MLTAKDDAPQQRVSKLGFEWDQDVRRADLPDHPLLLATHSTFHKVGLIWRPFRWVVLFLEIKQILISPRSTKLSFKQ